MWNNFVQSSTEDETISNAFCTNGVFRIWGDDLVSKYPQVCARVQNRKMIIAIDKSVILLEDENVAKCSFLGFNSHIDAVAVSNSGNIILCALSDGEIHGISIKGIPLFSLSIHLDDVKKGLTFCAIQQANNCYYIICASGSIYKLSDIDESYIESHLNVSMKESETFSIEETVMDNVTIEKLAGIRFLSEITSSAVLPLGASGDCLFLGSTTCFIRLQAKTVDTKITLSDSYEGVKQIYKLDNYIIFLTYSGHLLEICPHTKLCFQYPFSATYLIDDLSVMENNDNTIELLLLTKANESGVRTMKLVEFPYFKCIFEFEVGKHTWLVNQPKCSVNLYYLSGESTNSQFMPQIIELKLVSETQPAERLKKLIHKGHLEEAEEFGRQFELSLQPVYEAKAKKILREMSSSEDNVNLLEEYFQQLVRLLKIVQSKDFFKTIRLLEIPNRRILDMYLNEILQHLDPENDEECIRDIKEQQLRLKTLQLIDPCECNMEWQRFVYHSNITKLCSSYIKNDILTACLIWKRHSASITSNLDPPSVRKLMGLIPDTSTVEPFNIVQWLRHFVPSIVYTYPDLMPFLIEWSIQKTRSLQYSRYWPEIGLEFSTKVAEIFDEIQFLHSDVRRQNEKNVEKLRELVNALQDLVVLKKSYNLVFTLDNYIKDSLDDTTFCILQRVQITNLRSLVNDFLYPIYMERGQCPMKAIRKYITFLVASRQNSSSWLSRAVASIELLHNEDARLESALLVLQSAPVPWPETVASLTRLGSSTHPLAEKINTEYEIQTIKILKVKYGWPADGTDCNMKLIFKIVKTDLPEMIEDIKEFTKAAPEIQGSANFYCCYELARKGKIDAALDFFENLNIKQKFECCNKIANIFPDILEGAEIDDISYKNLFEFFKLVSQHSSHTDQDMLWRIQNCRNLRKRFQLDITIDNFKDRNIRREYLNIGISNLAGNFFKNFSRISEIWNEVCDLSELLGFEKTFGIIELCKTAECLPLSCALAYFVAELMECTKLNVEIFIDLALLVVSQQIKLCVDRQERDITFNTDPLSFPIVSKLLSRALQYKKYYQLELLDILKWIQIACNSYQLGAITEYYNVNEIDISERIKKYLNGIKMAQQKDNTQARRNSVSIFEETTCAQDSVKQRIFKDNSPAVDCISFALLLIMLKMKPKFDYFEKMSTFTLSQARVDSERLIEDFFRAFELLVKSRQHHLWYAIAQNLSEYQKIFDVRFIHNDILSLQIKRILRHLLSHKDPDFIDLFTMLISDSQPQLLLENLSYDLKFDIQKINFYKLAEMFNTHIEDMSKVKTIRERRLRQFYFTELCKQDACLRSKSNIDIISMTQLMKELRNNMLEVSLLERLSKDFGWDYQQVLISQVIAVLNLQEANFEVKVDTFGKEELFMKSSVDEMKIICQPYINEIKNTELLASKLLHFMSEINFYFYEHYLCVIEILNYIDALPKEMNLWTCILVFLKHKMISKRRNRPSQMETDWWLKSHSDIGLLPKISKYRLPFMPIVQNPLKDILDNEVNIENCESWFPLIKMHTILQSSASQSDIIKMQDYFCMSAVKNSIFEYKTTNDPDIWHLQPTNNAFLQSVLRLVQHVSSVSKVLLILYFVSSHAPYGADQVEAMYECYKYTLKHEEELLNEEKAVETIQKVKRKYPILKTQHLLHVYGLIEDKLLRLVESPKELIYCLYDSEIILKVNKPDINNLCKEIAELHHLDFDMLQFNMLKKWLSFAAVSPDVTALEETFYEDVHFSDVKETSSENVMRAHFILKSWNTDKAMQFLVGHIFPADGSVNTNKQLQMFECFSQLNDGSSSYNDVLNQQKYIIIKCVNDLKQLGYNFTLDKFASYDKITILKKIWQNQANNKFAMEVIANICLGFEIYIPKVWNGVLKQMVKFNMTRELNALVDVLSCNACILHTDGMIKAWEHVLKVPFKKANRTRSLEQEELLRKTLFRIQGCPLVCEINLTEIAEDCIRIDRPHLAAILIAFCYSSDQEIIKRMVQNNMKPNIRKDIIDLEESGILRYIIHFVLKEFNL